MLVLHVHPNEGLVSKMSIAMCVFFFPQCTSQGIQHFKKIKFPDFSLMIEVSKFHENYFNSFSVSHVFYVAVVKYLQYKTPVPHHGVKGEAAVEARGATPVWLFSVHNHV